MVVIFGTGKLISVKILTPVGLAFKAYQRYHLCHTNPNCPIVTTADRWNTYQGCCDMLTTHDREVLSGIVQTWWYARMRGASPNPTPSSPGEDP